MCAYLMSNIILYILVKITNWQLLKVRGGEEEGETEYRPVRLIQWTHDGETVVTIQI